MVTVPEIGQLRRGKAKARMDTQKGRKEQARVIKGRRIAKAWLGRQSMEKRMEKETQMTKARAKVVFAGTVVNQVI